jgi:hypothetical protein
MNQNRNKLILLAHDFEPTNTIAAQRINACSKYFSKYGFNVVVFCIGIENKKIENSNVEIFYVCKKNNLRDNIISKYGNNNFVIIRKILSLLYQLFQFHIPNFDINYSIYEACDAYLKKNKADFIIASGEPFILFKYASNLSKKHKIKWCADYRDDWIEDHGIRYAGLLTQLLTKLHKPIESKILKSAFLVTTVSHYLKKQIQNRTKHRHVAVIENGIDKEIFNKALQLANQNQNLFTICYTGRLYNSGYIKIFSAGFQKFISTIKNPDKVIVQFYGIDIQYNNAVNDVEQLKNQFPENIMIHPQISQVEAIVKQIEAHVLLNFIPGDVSKGIVGAKTYSYAYTRNFILTIPDITNKNTEFFPDSNAQYFALNADEVANALMHQFNLFQDNKRFVSNLSDHELESITREHQIKKWIKLLC